MEDCVIAHDLGSRVAEELGIPVYFYEEAATRPERRNLAAIRAGEYEGLAEKMNDPEWAPDRGAAVFNPRSGADGHRRPGVPDRVQHQPQHPGPQTGRRDRPGHPREGRIQRGPPAKIVKTRPGDSSKLPGQFEDVRAVGWYIEDYGRAQISINFTNYRITPIQTSFRRGHPPGPSGWGSGSPAASSSD